MDEDVISWAAYHSSLQPIETIIPGITALLPMFSEKADSPAMVKHGMNIIKQITEILNHAQVPVMACNCPIFAVAKTIQ